MPIYYRVDADYEAGLLSTNVIIEHDGSIELVIHALFRSVCNMDVEWYPFDQQVCKLQFASWTYDERQVSFMQHCTYVYIELLNIQRLTA